MFKRKIMLLAAVLGLSVISVQAAPWFSHNARRTPNTLVVTGNYKVPRLMAETILSLSKQPYLLIATDGRYFIVMSKDVQEVPAGKLDVYINNLNPKRLVILGDERYVTRQQEMLLRKINLKRIPVMRIYGNNWTRIAEELDDMLNIGNLARNFNRNVYEMDLRDPRLREAKTEKKADAPAADKPVTGEAAAPAAEQKPAAAQKPAAEQKPAAAPQTDELPVAEPAGK